MQQFSKSGLTKLDQNKKFNKFNNQTWLIGSSFYTQRQSSIFSFSSFLVHVFTCHLRSIIFIPLLLHPDVQLRCLLGLSPACPWSCGLCPKSPALTASVCNKSTGSCKSCCEDTCSHFVLGQLLRPLSSHLQLHKALRLLASPPW